jgi:DNA-directed RNA polymerase subunit RPC12/RpoP
MMKLPRCEWCKKPMHKLNNDGVYECRDCKVVIHHVECKHSRFRQYHTPYMTMKKCLECGQLFDEHALRSLSVMEKRANNRQNCADRLRHVIEIERARGKK